MAAAGGAGAAVANAANFVEVPSAVFYKVYTEETLEELNMEARDLVGETLEAVSTMTNRMNTGGISFELERVADVNRIFLRATGNLSLIRVFIRLAKAAGWKQKKSVSMYKIVGIRNTPNIRQRGFNGRHWLDPAENRSAAHGPRSEHPATAANPRTGRLSRSLSSAVVAAMVTDPGARVPQTNLNRYTMRRYGYMRRKQPAAAANGVYRRFRSDGDSVAAARAAARAAALVEGATDVEAHAAAEMAYQREVLEYAENIRGGPPQRLGGGARRTLKRRQK